MENNLGGVMFWAPDLDDFSGNFCNNAAYPLMNAVVNVIRSAKLVPVPTVTMTPQTPDKKEISPAVVCMMSDNPLVYQSLDPNLCTHIVLVQTPAATTSADLFETAAPSETGKQSQKDRFHHIENLLLQ